MPTEYFLPLTLLAAFVAFAAALAVTQHCLMGRPRQVLMFADTMICLVWGKGKDRRYEPPTSIAHRFCEGGRNRFGGPVPTYELRPRYVAISVVVGLLASLSVFGVSFALFFGS